MYFIYLNQTSVPVDKAVSRRQPTAKARRQQKSVIVCLSHHWQATEFRQRHGAAGHRCWEAAATADETTSCRRRVAAAAVAIIIVCPPLLMGRPSIEGCRHTLAYVTADGSRCRDTAVLSLRFARSPPPSPTDLNAA